MSETMGQPGDTVLPGRLGIGEAQLLRVERFFSRFGGRAVLFARFVGVLRALTPFVAGA